WAGPWGNREIPAPTTAASGLGVGFSDFSEVAYRSTLASTLPRLPPHFCQALSFAHGQCTPKLAQCNFASTLVHHKA
ncbi:MAG: hypothetical protein ACKPKO_63310, partial [Candidatus Fonsibacter sp.]